MWPKWLRSPRSVHISLSTPPPPPPPPATAPPSPKFSFSSFKDIHTLFTEDPKSGLEYGSPPGSPGSPIFHRVRSSASLLRAWSHRHAPTPRSPKPRPISLPHHEDQCIVVVYFTSLRIVRKTFEDCRAVRSILRGFRVPMDERDLSMDDKYVVELRGIMGTTILSLPLVFIRGKFIGGAQEIKELYEDGELQKLIAGLPLVDGDGACNLCGGLRFVLCEVCNGSHKIYVDKYGFKSCPSCNVNGLIRCRRAFPSDVGACHLARSP